MKSARWLRSIDALVRGAVGAVAILVALMLIQLVLDSLARNLLRTPLAGTIEVVTYLWMPAIAILALGYAQLRDEQIRVTILTEKSRTRVRLTLEIITEALSGTIAVLLAILTTQVFLSSLEIGKAPPAARWLVLWPGQLLVAIGFGICALAAVARITRLATGRVAAPETSSEGPVID